MVRLINNLAYWHQLVQHFFSPTCSKTRAPTLETEWQFAQIRPIRVSTNILIWNCSTSRILDHVWKILKYFFIYISGARSGPWSYSWLGRPQKKKRTHLIGVATATQINTDRKIRLHNSQFLPMKIWWRLTRQSEKDGVDTVRISSRRRNFLKKCVISDGINLEVSNGRIHGNKFMVSATARMESKTTTGT